jgi:hypothetical protein
VENGARAPGPAEIPAPCILPPPEAQELNDCRCRMENQSFIKRYVFSTDHKMICKQFLVTGMIWAVIGGFLSVLMRMQLGFPH